MLAPPGFWAPVFDHMSLTWLTGLPAPGYALSDVKPPPPLPELVLSFQPVPAASDISYLAALGGSWVALGGSWEGLGGFWEASKRHLGPKTVRARIFGRFLKKMKLWGSILATF